MKIICKQIYLHCCGYEILMCRGGGGQGEWGGGGGGEGRTKKAMVDKEKLG